MGKLRRTTNLPSSEPVVKFPQCVSVAVPLQQRPCKQSFHGVTPLIGKWGYSLSVDLAVRQRLLQFGHTRIGDLGVVEPERLQPGKFHEAHQPHDRRAQRVAQVDLLEYPSVAA